MPLDRTDFDILDALQNDARLSNKQLASRIGLAPSSCLERVRRLREGGVLGEAHAEVNPEVMGIGLQAMVAVRIQQQSRQVIESFHTHMLALPEVQVVYHLSGANDFLLHVAVRGAGSPARARSRRDLGAVGGAACGNRAHLRPSPSGGAAEFRLLERSVAASGRTLAVSRRAGFDPAG